VCQKDYIEIVLIEWRKWYYSQKCSNEPTKCVWYDGEENWF